MMFKLTQVRWKMRNFISNKVSDNLPMLTDPEMEMVFDIFTEIWFTVYEKGNTPLVYMTFLAMELQLTYGKPRSSMMWLSMYAISILNIYKDINLAVKYSEIAEQIYLTMPDKYSASMAHIWRGHLIDHWHCHVKLSTEHIEKGMQEARESGNILAYLLALFIHAFAQCAEAKSLSKATEILLISYTKADARGMEGMSTHFELLYHIYSILGNEDNGVTERFSYLENKICHSKSLLEYGTGQKFISFYYYFQEDYEKSIEFHFRWYVVEEKSAMNYL